MQLLREQKYGAKAIVVDYHNTISLPRAKEKIHQRLRNFRTTLQKIWNELSQKPLTSIKVC